MTQSQKEYYSRFAQFAIDCAKLIRILDWRIPSNKEWGKQLIRSSGSAGANYIEAIEGTTDPEFTLRGLHSPRTLRGCGATMQNLAL